MYKIDLKISINFQLKAFIMFFRFHHGNKILTFYMEKNDCYYSNGMQFDIYFTREEYKFQILILTRIFSVVRRVSRNLYPLALSI